MGDLSPHFSHAEFACRCGCGEDAVDPRLVELCENIRVLAGRPVGIRSGCRCYAHNAAEGGKDNSSHRTCLVDREYGQAADIDTPTPTDRWELLRAAFRSGARRIGIGHDYIHVDVDTEKDQDVVWLY
jgi:hypothetical protein